MKRYADPQAVEQQLRKIQQEISPNEARTNLFNLVVYVSDHDDRLLIEALNYLHGKRPTRVIVIRRNHGGVTHTDVTARCVPDENDKVLCIQEIVIFSGDDKAGEVPETWAPLLIREIPVFVWWLDKLDAAPVPQFFDDFADRCFVDSGFSDKPFEFFESLSSRLPILKTPLSDFAWVRLAPLMKVTANFFNPQEMREKLADVSKVHLEGAEAAEALLFFQWLRTKMDWKGPTFPEGQLWRLLSNNQPVELLHTSQAPLDKGFSLTFETRQGEKLSLKDTGEGFVVARGSENMEYTSIFRLPSMGEALLQEVDKNASDRLYYEALENW
ncbi:MAG: glucose-6-phosphate dehydrogenase assembly protein OpcA [Spirochaetales bacterium]|nr:glucose-6-phosphate dehydrogenase assembly protein OpcA [Spirochaetales bacterium]